MSLQQLFRKIKALVRGIDSDDASVGVPPAWFDADWYLQQYPDVAAAGVDPWRHYTRYGKREGRLPANDRALAMEHALWRGAHPVMVPRLQRLLAMPDLPEHEELSARRVLAQWHAWQQDWDRVVALLAPNGDVVAVTEAQPLLLLLEALCRLQLAEPSPAGRYSDLIDAVADRLEHQFPSLPDTSLAESNRLLARGVSEALRLEAINSVFSSRQLPGLQRFDPGRALALDNLATESAPLGSGSSPVLVSVIIPLYNAEHTIAVTLRGLFAQTWPRLEILVVDDASTDGSAGVVEALREECPRSVQLHLLRHDANQGAYAARNTGLAAACGELITVHDSDDWSHPCKLALQAQALQQRPDAQACLSWWVRVTDALFFHRWRLDEYGWCYPNISSLMFRRRVQQQLGFWDPVRVNADTEFRERIEAAYGRQAVFEVLPGVPLSFGRADTGSLSQHAQTHLVTVFAGVRNQYMQAARDWHARARNTNDLYLEPNAGQRPFVAPAAMLRSEDVPVDRPTERDRVRISGYFDAGWYLQRYIHLQQSLVEPFEHFWDVARSEGLDPGPDFSSSGYLRACPEAAQADNPLAHFLRYGEEENALPVWQGLPLRAGRPTLMVCGHQAGKTCFGAERSLLDVIRSLARLEFNLVVTLPEAMNADYEQQVLASCQALAILPYGWWQVGRHPVAKTVEHFRQLMRRFSVTALHANTLVLDEPMRAARSLGIPARVHVRELPAADSALCNVLGGDAEVIVRHAAEVSDLLIANSEHTRVELQKVLGDSVAIEVVPNTCDMAELRLLPELSAAPETGRRLRVGMLSSNLPKKGLADVEHLARTLHPRSPDIELILVGPETGELKALLERQARGEVPDNLTYQGYAPSPVEAMAGLDVVINLSHFQESFGRTVLEAMAAARPVVAYDWGALPELVVDGLTGFLVPLGDIEAVAQRLSRLAGSRELCRSLGCAGRARALSCFDSAALDNALRHVYRPAGVL